MQTYKYRLPANGKLDDMDDLQEFTFYVTNYLDMELYVNDTFLTDNNTSAIDHIEFKTNQDGIISFVNLYMCNKMNEGMENVLRKSVEYSIERAIEDCYDEYENKIVIEGPVEYMGMNTDLPDTLYHIASRKDIQKIMEQGISPSKGENDYKSDKDYVYLADEDDLAPWIAVLEHKDDPVILTISTKGLNDIEPGRTFADRSYMQSRYSEYRTTNIVPASAIQKVETLSGAISEKLCLTMSGYLQNACESAIEEMNNMTPERMENIKWEIYRDGKATCMIGMEEAVLGINRLVSIRCMKRVDAQMLMEKHDIQNVLNRMVDMNLADKDLVDNLMIPYKLPWEEQAGKDIMIALSEMENSGCKMNPISK